MGYTRRGGPPPTPLTDQPPPPTPSQPSSPMRRRYSSIRCSCPLERTHRPVPFSSSSQTQPLLYSQRISVALLSFVRHQHPLGAVREESLQFSVSPRHPLPRFALSQ